MKAVNKSDLILGSIDLAPGESHWDLRMFLISGCSALRKNKVAIELKKKKSDQEHSERRPMVYALHAELEHRIMRGDRPKTIENLLTAIRDLYRFVDTHNDLHPNKENIAHIFIRWMDWHDQKVKNKEEKASSRYRTGVTAGGLIAAALGINPESLYRIAGLKRNTTSRSRHIKSTTAKQILSDTLSFGHTLFDLTQAYTLDAIRGPLPIKIQFRNEMHYEDWGRYQKNTKKIPDTTNEARSAFINIRLEAELLIFIAQTGMNLTDAWNCKCGDFRYSASADGLGVRRYKGRKLGEVEFHIFSEYREHFENYLIFRRALQPNDPDGLLFPFIIKAGNCRAKRLNFERLQGRLNNIGVKVIGPQMLRKTRINWMLRQSSDKHGIAEAHGHSVEVLLDYYEMPHHQTAAVEISQFFSEFEEIRISAGPGTCAQVNPSSYVGAPISAPKPDCIQPDGCLFCTNNRDIDSQDHVWMLMSLRYLKSLELSRSGGSKDEIASEATLSVIKRVSDKIEWFQNSTIEHQTWVAECATRISEDNHHPRWAGWIAITERRT